LAQFIKNRRVKIIGIIAVSFLLLMASVTTALQTPAVQNRVIDYLTQYVSKQTGYHIGIDRISLQWFDEFKADKMEVRDLEGNLMIIARDVLINYELKALLINTTKVVDFIEINEAEVNARIINFNGDEENLNLTEFLNRLRTLNTSETGNKPIVVVEEVVLKNSVFTYMDHRKDTIIPGFNYYKFRVENINAKVSDMLAHADTLQMQIQRFSAHIPESNLPVHNITGQFRLSRKALEFNDIEIHAGKSIIRDTVIMAYESTRDLQDFNEKVDINAQLKNSIIHAEDLSVFVPALKNLDDKYRLTGSFQGRVNNFSLTNATLGLGNATNLNGSIRMEGLPNVAETFMNYKLVDSYVLIEDLKPYLREATIVRMEPLHHLSFSGQLIGFVNDFVANGEFNTELGKIRSDINLKLTEDLKNSVYSGRLALIDFDLGRYSNQSKVDKITLNGKIKGEGLDINNADFTLEGKVQSLGINNYTFRNITTNGRFKSQFFKGEIAIKDPNAEILLTGAIDLTNKEEKFLLNIKKLHLKPLNWSRKDISLSGKAVVNAKGLHIDSIFGDGFITDAFVQVEDKFWEIDTLSFYSRLNGEEREIILNSDLTDLKLYGQFTPTVAYQGIKQLAREYELALENNSNELNEYYQSKNISGLEDYKVNFDILVKNFNPFLNLIGDSLFVASGTSISGDLTGGLTSIFSIDLQSDSIRYKNNAFKKSLAEISISKTADSSDILAVAYLESAQQDLGKVLKTEKLQLEGIWNDNHIDFEFNLKQQNSTNQANINGNIDFLRDNMQVTFKDSDILMFEKLWQIPKNNLITFNRNEIILENLELYQEHQRISANGNLSRASGEYLEIKMDSVELYNINPILRKPINGLLNGRISIRDAFDDYKVNVIAAIKDFEVDSIPVGNIIGSSFYNDKLKKSEITFVVQQERKLIAALTGTYEPTAFKDKLALSGQINKAPLNIIEPFFESYFNSMTGTVSGKFSFGGSLVKPVIEGSGNIEDASLHVNYLNTDYKFDGNFSIAENLIAFNRLNVRDPENHTAYIEGSITHDYFNRFAMNLNGRVNRLLVLNTTRRDNNLFYGTGYATGSISFKGPVNNLTIAAQAQTDAGTKIFIPIGQSGEIEKQEFINFVSFSDSTVTNSGRSKDVDLTGLNLDLALDVTTDAYAEIIFDIKSGDIIRGRGEGDLRLQIDPTGEFSMFGDFFIQQGGYNFTLYNIVNKEFDILPDSRISWYGDPYQGQMNIKATYEQLASLRPVIPEVTDMENIPVEIKRKYPSKVQMKLNGPLLTPSIDFDIKVEDLPNHQVTLTDGTPIEMNFLFSRFKDSWDEQELNRQVFSLIVLRKFSPLQSFSTGGTIASSVSELLSNQLSYWITQVNENLEIDLDLGSLDEEAFNTFQLRLAYTLMDGRLRIIRDGGFTNPYDNSETKIQDYFGNWTVEYLLSPDGKLRVKMYNRTNYNTIHVNNQNSVITTGFSILHIQSFDQVKDLFKKSEDQRSAGTDEAGNKDANREEDEIL
jgi:hypothetical protein